LGRRRRKRETQNKLRKKKEDQIDNYTTPQGKNLSGFKKCVEGGGGQVKQLSPQKEELQSVFAKVLRRPPANTEKNTKRAVIRKKKQKPPQTKHTEPTPPHLGEKHPQQKNTKGPLLRVTSSPEYRSFSPSGKTQNEGGISLSPDKGEQPNRKPF